MSKKIGFIGPGKMAGAIIKGLLSGNMVKPEDIFVLGRGRERVEYFLGLGCNESKSIEEMNKDCSIIFLCIKPQNFSEIYLKMKPSVSKDNLYVSIAAGIDFKNLQENLGSEIKFVRAMPNTPLLVGKGATALCRTDNVSDKEYSLVKSIFESCGMTADVSEEQINAVIAVSGSSPAYIYMFAEAVCDKAEELGLSRAAAMKLFCQTMVGSAEMLLTTGLTESELIDMVSSKGGTTVAATTCLRENDFSGTVKSAMTACVKRAEELAGSK